MSASEAPALRSRRPIRKRRRVACSGQARAVLDHIDRIEYNATRVSRTLTLPLAPGEYAYLQVPMPMHADEWDLMLSVLVAFRPGIVA